MLDFDEGERAIFRKGFALMMGMAFGIGLPMIMLVVLINLLVRLGLL